MQDFKSLCQRLWFPTLWLTDTICTAQLSQKHSVANQKDVKKSSDRDPCWSCENSTTWLAMSDNCMFGIWLLRKSSNSWLRPVASFDAAVLHHTNTYQCNPKSKRIITTTITLTKITLASLHAQQI